MFRFLVVADEQHPQSDDSVVIGLDPLVCDHLQKLVHLPGLCLHLEPDEDVVPEHFVLVRLEVGGDALDFLEQLLVFVGEAVRLDRRDQFPAPRVLEEVALPRFDRLARHLALEVLGHLFLSARLV